MITTPEPVLKKVSMRLNESTTDNTVYGAAKKIEAFNLGMKHFLGYKPFKFAIKKHDLSVSAGVQEYDLTSVISSYIYDVAWGIDEVWSGTDQIFPIPGEQRGNYTKTQAFYFSQDEKSIIFTKTLDGTENLDIYHYCQHTDVSAYNDTLDIAIPDAYERALVLIVKHYVHDYKRQRNDARNAILDYQEVMEEIALQMSGKKAKHLKKQVESPLGYVGVKRTYVNH